ncbi:DUF6255 family natural product biosynthesis protein [Streptomyces eurocidicus]|uniref:DUF6255 family natural product biosynthesis protein n=1 Tax=Streptomyces eurocidicus TaxID=66423 RepID=UPI003CC81955
MNNCLHHGGWTHHGGESRCDNCGVRRFTEYGAVRPSGLPHAVTPAAPDRRATDRAAALNISRAVLDSRGFGSAPPWRSPHTPGPGSPCRTTAEDSASPLLITGSRRPPGRSRTALAPGPQASRPGG